MWIVYPPPCECTTECLGSSNWPLSCLSDIWMPFRCLGSEQEGLLEDFKDPPKTAGADPPPFGAPTAEASLTPSKRVKKFQDAFRRLGSEQEAS